MSKLEDLKDVRKILYCIDMVNGFVKEGALHDKHILSVVPEQIRLIDKFISEDERIAFIKECHNNDSMEFNSFPPHCITGTSEAELISEIKDYEKDALVYLKNSTSGMFAKGMLEDLNSMISLNEVVGVGCCTDICVLNFLIPLKNYFNENNRDVKVFVVTNATDTYHIDGIHDRDYYNKIAYELMKQSGVIVVKDIFELNRKEKEMGLVRRRVM